MFDSEGNSKMLTKQKLAKRWDCTTQKIDKIPPRKLPRIDISGGMKRPTWRFRPDHVQAYEDRFMRGGE